MRLAGTPVALAGFLIVLGAASAAAQAPRLGEIHFPTSGSGAAQDAFVWGVLFLHSFEYEDAATAFREAQSHDPDFAMAYWGEAMTYNHPMWAQTDPEAAQRALARLAPTPEARLAKAPTQREKDFLGAVEALYGPGDKRARDVAYSGRMRRMAATYPDDPEVAAFYALSILGTAHEGRDFATYMRAAAVVENVFRENPRHPGAVHYLIHSYDDPIHAPLGLRAARAYSAIAPDAAHAQHMTSHIFVAMGMWDDVVTANETARDVQNARLARLGRPANVCGHYTSWLEYGYLEQGRYGDALTVMDDCAQRVAGGADPEEIGYYARMRARYVLDSERWKAASLWTGSIEGHRQASVIDRFTTAFAGLKQGDRTAAAALLADLDGSADPSSADRILADELRALVLLADGEGDRAVELLRRAASVEKSLPYEFGPPAIVKPSHELLGEVLMELGRAGEARAAFEGALARAPRRTLSLLGLARASEEVGDRAVADEAYAHLRDIWRNADPDLSALEDVAATREP